MFEEVLTQIEHQILIQDKMVMILVLMLSTRKVYKKYWTKSQFGGLINFIMKKSNPDRYYYCWSNIYTPISQALVLMVVNSTIMVMLIIKKGTD